MPNLFGWLNHPFSEKNIQNLRERYPFSNPWVKGSAAGLLKSDAEVGTFENCWIAWAGHPYWRSKEFDALAKEQGFEKAVYQAYRQLDKDFLRLLGGQFALAIVEPEINHVLLAIDRMGIRSLAYADRQVFAFSVSLGDLKNFFSPESELSEQALYNYVYFHMVPSPDTVYQGIHKLGPAQYLEYQNGALEIGEYWKPVFLDDGDRSADDLAKELRETLSTAVSRSLRGDPSGAFLSGGLDSSSVVGCFAKLDSDPVRTYTIAFDAKGYDESEYARIAAEHFGTRHTIYALQPEDVLKAIPRITAAYDEPFGNSSAIPTFYCAKRAREDGVETLLAGDGGDELFAGNERYAAQMLFEPFAYLPQALRQSLLKIVNRPSGMDSWTLFRKARGFIRLAMTPLPDRLENYNFLHRHDIDEIFEPHFLEKVNPSAPLNHLRNYFNKIDPASSLNRMLYLDWKRTLADNDLRKVNEMCRLAGVTVEYPMLDDELVELSCRIPDRLKLKRGRLRYFYKFALKDFLPERILNKSKHGFGLPFGVWIRDHRDLRDFAYSQVTRLKSRGIFRSDFLDESIRLHREGHAAYYGELVWILMMLECWLSHHCDAA